MAITATIGNVAVNIIEATLQCDDTSDGRSVATFVVKDLTGTQHYQPGQPVVITDTTNNYSFTGVVNDSQETPLPPNAAILSNVSCVDGHYYGDKRYWAGPEWTNRNAGDIAIDLLQNVLAAEGIVSSYAVDRDQTLADWSKGTQNGTQATANNNGDLELAPGGAGVTFQQITQSDFNAGFTGGGLVSPASGGLMFASTQAIKLQASVTMAGAGNAYTYVKIWAAGYTITSGDVFSYDIWISDTCPQQFAGVDFVCSDGTTLRDNQAVVGTDAQGVGPHPNNDLSGLATDTWYGRGFAIGQGSFVGKTISYVTVAFEGDNVGAYTAYFRNIFIKNGGTTKVTVFGPTATATAIVPQQMQRRGYAGVSCNVVTSYEHHAYAYSPYFSLAAAGLAGTSNINWAITYPNNNANNNFVFTITASIDNFATFLPVTQNAPIPGLLPGRNLSGVNIILVYVFDNFGNDPTLTPVLNEVVGTLQSAPNVVKSDIVSTTNTQAGWNAGTLTNLNAPGGAVLQLTGSARNWDDAFFGNQTTYGNGSPVQGVLVKTFFLSCAATNETRSRCDFAGQYANFTLEFDVLIDTTGINYSCVYRTTGWVNGDSTYAYAVEISTTLVALRVGSNGGASSSSQIASASLSLASGNTHHVKVIANGSNHQVFIDDTQYINATDSTYTAAGYVGLRNRNTTTSTYTMYVDNFGIANALSGTWVSPAIDIHSLGTISNSQIMLEIDQTPTISLCTYLVEVSLNNGTTWTAATNVQTIPGWYQSTPLPGLASGTNVSGITQMKIRITITASTAATGSVMPDITAITLTLLGAYSASGNRVSPALNLANVGRAGNTEIVWSAILPPNTNLFVDTSTDGSTFTQVGSGASGSAPVAGIITQSEPFIDLFTSNDALSYTNTYRTGGALATLTWDTTHSRLQTSGGTDGLILYNSPQTGADTDVSAILDQSDNGGFFWRYQDQGNFYYLTIHDASNLTAPNIMQLYKVVGNVRTQIGSNATINFTRSIPHTFRVIMTGTAITASMDGVTIISATDSAISAAGFAGLYTTTNGGSSANFYMFRLQFYGQNVTAMNINSRVRLTSTDPTVTPQVTMMIMSVRTADIQTGALIATTNYSILNGNKKTVAAIYDDLAKQSSGFWWRIVAGRLFFQKHQSTPAPWVITPNDAMVQNFEVDNINDLYRNSEWGVGGKDTIPDTRAFIGDGTRTTFTTAFPIDSITSLTLNGVVQTFGVKGVDTGKQWYYTKGKTELAQDKNGIPLALTQTLTLAYNGQVDIVTNVQRPAEIARLKALDNSSGIIDLADDMTGLKKGAMISKCNGYLDQYAQGAKTLKFTTLRAGLAVGQLQGAFISGFGIFGGAYLIVEVKTTWKTAVVNGVSNQQPWYEVTATSGPIVGDWTRFINDLSIS